MNLFVVKLRGHNAFVVNFLSSPESLGHFLINATMLAILTDNLLGLNDYRRVTYFFKGG